MASVSNEKFVAYIERFGDTALITIHPRPAGDRYGIDFSKVSANYETLSRGAAASARKEISKLTEQPL